MVVTDIPRQRAGREERRDWWKSAACQDADPELFFPVSSVGLSRKDIARAKAVCASCVVRQPCLQFALATHQTYGVWGGTTEEERRELQTVSRRLRLAPFAFGY
jgi:WhiB family redox-sensing transcriptional regulator